MIEVRNLWIHTLYITVLDKAYINVCKLRLTAQYF